MSEITIIEAHQSAAEAVARQQQLAELDKTAYPLEAEPKRLTLRQRWNAFWRRRRITIVQRELAVERERLAGLTDAADGKKHAAQLAYGVHLQQIDCWRDTEAALAKSKLRQLSAELELLEAAECV